jgi:hypothetical protein
VNESGTYHRGHQGVAVKWRETVRHRLRRCCGDHQCDGEERSSQIDGPVWFVFIFFDEAGGGLQERGDEPD